MHADPLPAADTITRANWRQRPYSRRAFCEIDRLLPVAELANAGPPMPLPQRPVDFTTLRITLRAGESLTLEEFAGRTYTDGLIIVADGKLLHESLYPPLTASTRHILMSATKSVVGLVCGLLAGQGRLDPQAPVSDYVPEIRGSGYDGATVRQLLDMRADPGLDADDLARYAAATNWEPQAPDAAPADLQRFFAELPARRGRHGGVFRYISANTDLLGWVIERAAGRRFADVAAERLWSPLGAEHPAYITVDDAGAPRTTGGLCATLRDFARLGVLVAAGGRREDGRQVLPADWIDDLATGGDRRAWDDGEFAQAFGRLPMCYRSGWYRLEGPQPLLFAMGVHGQHLFVDPASRLVIAKLSSYPQALDAGATGRTLAAVAALRRFLTPAG